MTAAHSYFEAPVGDEIRRRRLDAGLDQQQLAELVGCSRNTISHYETGETMPKVPMYRRIVEECEKRIHLIGHLRSAFLPDGQMELDLGDPPLLTTV
jgi:transcriptional regulator with XRE-family HTH domain